LPGSGGGVYNRRVNEISIGLLLVWLLAIYPLVLAVIDFRGSRLILAIAEQYQSDGLALEIARSGRRLAVFRLVSHAFIAAFFSWLLVASALAPKGKPSRGYQGSAIGLIPDHDRSSAPHLKHSVIGHP
jgi:hypothetical protein